MLDPNNPAGGLSPFDWDLASAAHPHVPNDSNAVSLVRDGAMPANRFPNGLGGKTL